MGNILLLGKFFACGLGLLATWWGCRRFANPDSVSSSQFDKGVLAALLLSRAGLYVLLFGVLGLSPESDIRLYVDQGLGVLRGEIPNREFASSYGPLFPYLVAGVLTLWSSTKAYVLLMIIAEIASVRLWLSVSRKITSETNVRLASIAYVCSPIPLLSVAMTGQNQILISLFLALSLLALLSKHSVLSGVWIGLSVLSVKGLGFLYAPAFFSMAPSRKKWMLGLVGIVGSVYAAFAAVGARPWDWIVLEKDNVLSGNFLFLATSIGLNLSSPLASTVMNIYGLILLGTLSAILFFKARSVATVPVAITLLTCALMLSTKKAGAHYWAACFWPACLCIAHRFSRPKFFLVYCVFTLAATLDLSLWFRWMNQGDFSLFWSPRSSSSPSSLKMGVFFCLETGLMVSYLFFLKHFLSDLFQKARRPGVVRPLGKERKGKSSQRREKRSSITTKFSG